MENWSQDLTSDEWMLKGSRSPRKKRRMWKASCLDALRLELTHIRIRSQSRVFETENWWEMSQIQSETEERIWLVKLDNERSTHPQLLPLLQASNSQRPGSTHGISTFQNSIVVAIRSVVLNSVRSVDSRETSTDDENFFVFNLRYHLCLCERKRLGGVRVRIRRKVGGRRTKERRRFRGKGLNRSSWSEIPTQKHRRCERRAPSLQSIGMRSSLSHQRDRHIGAQCILWELLAKSRSCELRFCEDRWREMKRGDQSLRAWDGSDRYKGV